LLIMSKRSRQRARPRPQLPAPQLRQQQQQSNDPPPVEPERLLLDQIAAGVLDEHLTAISESVHGVIVELDYHTATVCMHRPVGRFKSGEIRCPPLILDRLNPAA
jgi:hypothetical protein